MAPIVSRPSSSSAFKRSVCMAFLAFTAVNAVNGQLESSTTGSNVTASTGTSTPEPDNWAVHQMCVWPRVNVCSPNSSTGFIEDEIRAFYDTWGKGDIRREFIENEFFIGEPGLDDPKHEEWSIVNLKWLEPIFNFWFDLYEKETAEQQKNPEKVPEEYSQPEYPDGAMDHVKPLDICCPAEFPCMVSRSRGKPYCYNSNLTAYLMTESFDPRDQAGAMNIKEFIYTRRDGTVYTLLPKKLLSTTASEVNEPTRTSSVEISIPTLANTSTTCTTLTKPIKSTVTTTVVTTSTLTMTINTQTPAVNSTTEIHSPAVNATKTNGTIEVTESGSVGSTITTKPGPMPFLAAVGSLFLTGLGAVLIL